MKKPSDFLLSFFQALFVALYCAGVVALMNFLGRHFSFFGNDMYSGLGVLMLFLVSALVTGGAVLGYPAYLALNKQFGRAVKLVAGVTFWLLLFFVLILTSFAVATLTC